MSPHLSLSFDFRSIETGQLSCKEMPDYTLPAPNKPKILSSGWELNDIQMFGMQKVLCLKTIF